MKKPLVLMILDGFGIAPKEGNAIAAAKTPTNTNSLADQYWCNLLMMPTG